MDKKQALKTAAYDVFSKKGYKATAISEIAKQAGVAVGSFYNYYDSKEAIFLDVYVDENNRVRQAMINELDWEMNDMVGLVSQIFSRSRSYVSSNKILPIEGALVPKFGNEASIGFYLFYILLMRGRIDDVQSMS